MRGGPIPPGPWMKALLFVPGVLYGRAVEARNALYDRGWLRPRRLPCPAVSFGNLTVGGTGKTPITLHCARALRDAGLAVGVVSRGYGRRGGRGALLVSDGRAILADARSAGDEPCLIARGAPGVRVAVGADRERAARLLLEPAPPDVLLLDDAFQHRSVARDLDVLLVDGVEPFGNGKILPFGPMREPAAAVARAGALVVTRGDGGCPAALRDLLERHHPNVPLFHARLAPGRFVPPRGEPVAAARLAGAAALAFSGIARPDRFEADLESIGLRLVARRRFPDHHLYTPGDLDTLAAETRRSGAEVVVTTEKDLVRLGPLAVDRPLYALSIEVIFAGADLPRFLLERLRALAPRASASGGGA